MIAVVVTLLLAMHLICMNISSGAPILCAWLSRRSQLQREPQTREIILRLALAANWTLLAGALLGFALGLTSYASGQPQLASVLPLFRYKIGWGFIELVVSAVWMFVYWSWLKWRPPNSMVARWSHAGLALLSATNLLYHFPMLLTVMSKSARGDLPLAAAVDASVFRGLAFRPEVLAHAVHFWLASIAVSGVFLFWFIRPATSAPSVVVTGARFALAATVLQIPAGLWLVMVTPPETQANLVGGDGLTTSLLVVSIFCAFYLLQNLATVAFGEVEKRPMRYSFWLLLVTVVLMSGTLHRIRH